MIKVITIELYLSKALEAEEASKCTPNDELREAWLEIAQYYRLLAARMPRPRASLSPLTDV